MSKELLVPFDKNGNQKERCYKWEDKNSYDLVPNFEFTATLQYTTTHWASSSYHVIWMDVKTKTEYISTYPLLHKAITGKFPAELKNGALTIKGKFTFRKQGVAYFLKEME